MKSRIVPWILLSMLGCAAPETAARNEALVGGASLAQVVVGQILFNNEDFEGNGRRCSSCHTTVERTLELGCAMGLTPAQQLQLTAYHTTFDLDPTFAQLVYAEDPTDGLFRDIDRDPDGSFTRLREQGLIRVQIRIPSNIRVTPIGTEAEGNLQTLMDGTQILTVLRSAPNTSNLAEDPICRMWDCRVQGAFSIATLGRQAGGSDGLHGALGDHFEPGRAMTPTERLAIGAFEAQVFTRPDLFVHANNGTQPSLPPCDPARPATCRGREFFVDQPALASDMGHRGLCAMCHSGPGLNRTNEFNPTQPPAARLADGSCPCIVGGLPASNGVGIDYFTEHALPDGSCAGQGLPTVPGYTLAGAPVCFHRVANNVVSERNLAGLPEYWFEGVDPTYGPIKYRSPDLGHSLQSGRLCELAAGCFLSPFSLSQQPLPGFLGTQSTFRIQSLWGASRRHRFNHDNGARSLEEALAHLQDFFHETVLGLQAFGDPNAAAFEISDQDAADIIAYIRGVGL